VPSSSWPRLARRVLEVQRERRKGGIWRSRRFGPSGPSPPASRSRFEAVTGARRLVDGFFERDHGLLPKRKASQGGELSLLRSHQVKRFGSFRSFSGLGDLEGSDVRAISPRVSVREERKCSRAVLWRARGSLILGPCH